MLYKVLKKMIINHNYDNAATMQTKLDVFYATDRINQEQYEELTALLQANEAA